jgi:glycosyltransferase involved in cell wall biosynthesis
LIISIITVAFNSERYIEETILSVLSQSYSDIEYIIVDGNSTDNTHKILERYRKKISKIIIENDRSMYDAINKGIRASKGDVVAILNSDDVFASNNVIEQLVDFFKKTKYSGCYSNIINVYNGCEINKKVFQVDFNDYIVSGKGTFVPHTSLYVRREVLDKVGLYSLDYHYASDYDFTLRVLKSYNIKHIDNYLFKFRRHPGSITSSGKIKNERKLILKKYNHRIKFSKYKKKYLWAKYYFNNFSYLNVKSFIRRKCLNYFY